jgi:hypothetical protein
MLLNRTSAVMLLNRNGGVVWALKPPVALVHKTTLCTYDLYGPVHNAFDAGSIYYLGKWEGVGPWNLNFFGPQMALAYRLNAISQGPKKSRFPGPNPLPLALVMDAARIKSITHGAI